VSDAAPLDVSGEERPAGQTVVSVLSPIAAMSGPIDRCLESANSRIRRVNRGTLLNQRRPDARTCSVRRTRSSMLWQLGAQRKQESAIRNPAQQMPA